MTTDLLIMNCNRAIEDIGHRENRELDLEQWSMCILGVLSATVTFRWRPEGQSKPCWEGSRRKIKTLQAQRFRAEALQQKTAWCTPGI